MSDDKPPSKQTGWLDRLVHILSPTPENRDELADVLQKSHESSIIDDDALHIMEGALHISEQHAGDIMIPRSQMLAKDLLSLLTQGLESFDIKSMLRPATIIPETKRLSVLLREFREQRYHMAIVVDEYGSVSGLLTIEDILEEIVGEIEDETDEHEPEEIHAVAENNYVIEAQIQIDDFNERFQSGLSEQDYDTLGGLITSKFGYVPEVNESIELDGFTFTVIETDGRRILQLRASRSQPIEVEQKGVE